MSHPIAALADHRARGRGMACGVTVSQNPRRGRAVAKILPARNAADSLARSTVLQNRTLEVRGSIPLGSTGKPKGLAAMRDLRRFRPSARGEPSRTASAAAIGAARVMPGGSSASSRWATSCRRVEVAAAACREQPVHDQRRRHRDQRAVPPPGPGRGLRAAHPAGGHQAATFSGTASNGAIRASLSSLYVPTILHVPSSSR